MYLKIVIYVLLTVALYGHNLLASQPIALTDIDFNNTGQLTGSQRIIQYDMDKIKGFYGLFTLDEYNRDPNQWVNKNVRIKDNIISKIPIVLNCRNLFVIGSLQAPDIKFNVTNYFAVNNNRFRVFNHITSFYKNIGYSGTIRDDKINYQELPFYSVKQYLNQIRTEPGLLRSTVGGIEIRALNDIVCIGSIMYGRAKICLTADGHIHLETAKRRNIYQMIVIDNSLPSACDDKIMTTPIDEFCPYNMVISQEDLLFKAVKGCYYQDSILMSVNGCYKGQNDQNTTTISLDVR